MDVHLDPSVLRLELLLPEFVVAGTALGVQRGMKLAVYRADKFVAYFHVAQAKLDSASGFLIGRKLNPIVGDTVMAIPK